MPATHCHLEPISSWEDDGAVPPALTATASDVSDLVMRKRTQTTVDRARRIPKSPKDQMGRRRLIKRQESAPDVLKIEPAIGEQAPVAPARKKHQAKKEASEQRMRNWEQKLSPPQFKLSSSPDLSAAGNQSPTIGAKFNSPRKNSLITSLFAKPMERGASMSAASTNTQSSASDNYSTASTFFGDPLFGKGGAIDVATIKSLARKFSSKKRKQTLGMELASHQKMLLSISINVVSTNNRIYALTNQLDPLERPAAYFVLIRSNRVRCTNIVQLSKFS